MLIKRLIFCLSLVISCSLNAQDVKPTIWEVRFSKDTFVKNDTITIYFIGIIPEHQGVYATKFKCDYGPRLTRVNYTRPGRNYEIMDSAISVNDSIAFDDIFECHLRKFKGVAIIKQVILIKNIKAEIKGKLEYQTCTADQCLPYGMYFETKGTKVLKVENGK